VSPAGEIVLASDDCNTEVDGQKKGERLRFVDGGYFEDTGALTASELEANLRSLLGSKCADDRSCDLRLLIIRNGTAEGNKRGRINWLDSLAGEAMPPLKALLRARSARSEEVVARLQAQPEKKDPCAAGEKVCEIVLPAPDPRRDPQSAGVSGVPLGWVLSKRSRDYMDKKAEMAVMKVWCWLRSDGSSQPECASPQNGSKVAETGPVGLRTP
jgi:hypothetical protein